MAEQRLGVSATATVGSDGIATVTVQPLRSFTTWFVEGMTVANTSTVNSPTATVYRGSVSASNRVDATYSGRQDQSDTHLTVLNGERLLCQWTKADPNSVCVFTVYGREVSGVQ